MSNGPATGNLSFAIREAERLGQNSTGRQAMILNQVAVGCMVAMALPAIFQAIHGVWRGVTGSGEMSHAQRLNYERAVRDLDRRGMWHGDQRGPVRDGGHPDPYPRRMG